VLVYVCLSDEIGALTARRLDVRTKTSELPVKMKDALVGIGDRNALFTMSQL
jgi:hypothetical protein